MRRTLEKTLAKRGQIRQDPVERFLYAERSGGYVIRSKAEDVVLAKEQAPGRSHNDAGFGEYANGLIEAHVVVKRRAERNLFYTIRSGVPAAPPASTPVLTKAPALPAPVTKR